MRPKPDANGVVSTPFARPHDAENIGEYAYKSEEEFFSVDCFLYVRCAVVANGKEVYEAALKDPTKILKDLEFESLLAIANNAYELKTGDSNDPSTAQRGCHSLK